MFAERFFLRLRLILSAMYRVHVFAASGHALPEKSCALTVKRALLRMLALLVSLSHGHVFPMMWRYGGKVHHFGQPAGKVGAVSNDPNWQ
jgi:hypothetical protein